MVHLHVVTPTSSQLLSLTEEGNVTYSDIVYILMSDDTKRRFRVVIPAGTKVRKRHPIIESLRKLRETPFSYKEVDDARLIAIEKYTRCPKFLLDLRRVDLYCDGFARKLWKYWRVPVK